MNESNNLDNLSSILQILSFLILTGDFNNTDLMKYLKHQDELLNKIIKQNEKIIDLLKSKGDYNEEHNFKRSFWPYNR